ncbi:hypothetical protein BXY66_2315 [Shimia isoporae]|uniref:Uncharacterized protein n=1 Tax=Shimia isoporae TaxID=647720 RepID=A0A4R1NP36_9RHOB|nr:hypothetical protein BXY66_2315 [Shimia isoporae]
MKNSQVFYKCLAAGLVWIAAPAPLWIMLAFSAFQ